MRLSVTARHQHQGNNAEIADWIVYHARSQGSKDHVVLEKYPKPSEEQIFYCFDQGIMGRTGTNLTSLPVVEHGFWADGMRNTVVLSYNQTTGEMGRICYIRQQKQPDDPAFDVSASNSDHVSILPDDANTPSRAMNEMEQRRLFTEWSTVTIQRVERLDGTYQSSNDEGALMRLLGPSNEMLRLQLPNGVVLSCPWSLQDGGDAFFISLGYKRPCGQIQILELNYLQGVLQWIQSSWYAVNK